jgi:triacylglycerol lipase
VPRLTPRDGRGGLANLARQLKDDINARFGPDSRIAVIAFSMGGIVSRYYLQELGGAERCDAFMTISSPHQGTAAAWCYPTQGAMEMRPGSDFLRQLEQSEYRLDGIPVVSYRTRFDLIILPPASSVWARAENIEVPVLLHPLMLSCNRIITDIERRLLALPR